MTDPTAFRAHRRALSANAEHVVITRQGKELSYSVVARAWQRDATFREFFLLLLRSVPYAAYYWETPPITAGTWTRRFEFVVLNGPELALRQPDASAFVEHFAHTEGEVAVFPNLGGDATLLAPTPSTEAAAYVHLGAFVRDAPGDQQHALWCTLGRVVERNLSARPLWVSTAGMGVAWLHVRLDRVPKYYRHAAYRVEPAT